MKINKGDQPVANRLSIIVATGAFVCAGLFAHAHAAAKPAQLTTDEAKLSYTLGVDVGMQFKKHGIQIDPATFARGIQDSMHNNPLLLSQESMDEILSSFHKLLAYKKEQEFKQRGEENAALGKEFLSFNAKKSSIHSTASGLQYKIINKGKGTKPTDTDIVTVNYVGKLLNGRVFDDSYRTGKPVSFAVSEVIPGMTEALKMMKPGAEWELYIPPDLAYGARGIGSDIGPNETLVFRVELLSVKTNKNTN